MKLQIFSDLHIEFGEYEPVVQHDVDAVILAGDIHMGEKGFWWIMEKFPRQKVIYILGNHEYYRQTYPDLLWRLRELSDGTDVHVLENEGVTIGDVRFLGCTFWSDFKLLNDPEGSAQTAYEMMNDYRLIGKGSKPEPIHTRDTAGWNRDSETWLKRELESKRCADKKKVVITHHAPSVRSVPLYCSAHPFAASLASDMERFMEEHGVALWVHGHLHNSSDYRIGRARVVCNPRGYWSHALNSAFSGDFVVEI